MNKLDTRVFTLIIIILIVIVFILFFKRNFKIFNSQPFENIWNKNKSKKMISLIKRTQKCFKELNIDFIPIYGSLLGIMRHKSIIQWDDDYDICVHKKYFEIHEFF